MILEELLTETLAAVDETLADAKPALHVQEVGYVSHIKGSIVRVSGLKNIALEELLQFPNDLLGIAINLDEHEVGVVLLGASDRLKAGDEVQGTGRQVDTPVGENLLGRIIDATGHALDNGSAPRTLHRRPIERDAPSIMDRAPVTVPLQTGLKVVDALIPIGRGQRELIIGDRQTGKTSVAVNAILNQRDTGVICIYCAIGQRSTAVARVIDTLRERGALEYTSVVVASGDDTPGLQYITPYAATTMAEHLMEQGRDVLVVYDDLTRHARAYREISLLLRRPPGREAYPGDIFYIHSRLLERSTHLNSERGGGSLTALPIAETQAGDISAYIPTNLISITDGQIVLSSELFRKGYLPAIDVGKSVSRVGGKTQLPAYRRVTGDLRLSYSQFEELETFARFSTRLDKDTLMVINRGRKARELLRQAEHLTLDVHEQITTLYALASNLLDSIELEHIEESELAIRSQIYEQAPTPCKKMDSEGVLSNQDWLELRQAIQNILKPLHSPSTREES